MGITALIAEMVVIGFFGLVWIVPVLIRTCPAEYALTLTIALTQGIKDWAIIITII